MNILDTLKKLGFTSSKNFIELEEENKNNLVLINKELSKVKQEKMKTYFSTKYPNYKLFNKLELDNFLNDLKLDYIYVNYYIGEIPNHILNNLIKFKIDKKDDCYINGNVLIDEPIVYNDFIKLKNNEKNGNLTTPSLFTDTDVYGVPVDKKYVVSPYSIACKPNYIKYRCGLNNTIIKSELDKKIIFKELMYEKEKYYLLVDKFEN